MNNYDTQNKGVFSRIISFFKSFFRSNKKLLPEDQSNPIQDKASETNQINDFKEQLKVKEDTEKNRLLCLRQQWENGEIEEEDISENDVDAIVAIYNAETEKIEQETELIKQDIAKMLNKLKESA